MAAVDSIQQALADRRLTMLRQQYATAADLDRVAITFTAEA